MVAGRAPTLKTTCLLLTNKSLWWSPLPGKRRRGCKAGGGAYLQLGQSLDGFQGPQDPQHTERLDGLDIPALVGPATSEGGTSTQKMKERDDNLVDLGALGS